MLTNEINLKDEFKLKDDEEKFLGSMKIEKVPDSLPSYQVSWFFYAIRHLFITFDFIVLNLINILNKRLNYGRKIIKLFMMKPTRVSLLRLVRNIIQTIRNYYSLVI
jgi:hypothetical protein